LELFPDHTASREIGVTTGRKRRIGWLDVPLLSHTIHLNGVDSLAVMKLDILDGLDELKICVGYKIKGKIVTSFPPVLEDLALVEPVYETLEGWKSPTVLVKVFEDLPKRAKAYLRRIEELTGVDIGIISVGPSRDQTLWRDSFFEGE
jgi:adenylosuccinate synthase